MGSIGAATLPKLADSVETKGKCSASTAYEGQVNGLKMDASSMYGGEQRLG